MYMTVKQAAEKWGISDRRVYRKIPVRIMGAKHEPIQPYLIHPFIEGKHSIGQMIIKLKYQVKLKIKKLDIFLFQILLKI